MMKAYSVMITIVAVLALGSAGYFYVQNTRANSDVAAVKLEKDGLQKDLDKTNQELTSTKANFDGIKPFSAALKAVLSSFIAGGNTQVGTVNAAEGTVVRQQINAITDETDKTSAQKSWDNFSVSNRLNDLQPLLITLSDGIDRNIKNTTNPPTN